MFNTKRIKALEESVLTLVRQLEITVDGSNKAIEMINDRKILSTIPCSTCKCLIRKEDAIRGESEIVEKHFGLDFAGKETIVEEIQKHFYCHSKDCKPKKLK